MCVCVCIYIEHKISGRKENIQKKKRKYGADERTLKKSACSAPHPLSSNTLAAPKKFFFTRLTYCGFTTEGKELAGKENRSLIHF